MAAASVFKRRCSSSASSRGAGKMVKISLRETSGVFSSAAHAIGEETPGIISVLYRSESLSNIYMNEP